MDELVDVDWLVEEDVETEVVVEVDVEEVEDDVDVEVVASTALPQQRCSLAALVGKPSYIS